MSPIFFPPTVADIGRVPTYDRLSDKVMRHFASAYRGRSVVGATQYTPNGIIQALSANDSGFETSVAGWVKSGVAPIQRSTEQAYSGQASLRAQESSPAPSVGAIYPASAPPYPPVVAGRTYGISCWVRSAVTTADRSAAAILNFLDSGFQTLTQAGTIITPVAEEWRQSAAEGVAPEGALWAQLVIVASGTTIQPSEIYYFDEVAFGLVGKTYRIEDGPDMDLLEPLTQGDDYFLGGHYYEVSEDIANALEASGLTVE